jgi:hypothetical protein
VGIIPHFISKVGDKLTQQEKNDWTELYEYVKINVLGYEDKIMPKNFILRLKGLASGKFMANNKIKSHASYTFKEILLTFKLSNAKIQDYISRTSFSNEQHKFNGIMVIVESEINNVKSIIERKNKSVEKTEKIDLSHQSNEQAEYKTKGKITTNEKLKGLL